jgi:putative transposase
MAWRNTKVEDQRMIFIKEYLEYGHSLSDLCRHFDISRPTAYKWIERYKSSGIEGMRDRSRKPLSNPLTTPQYIQDDILSIKYKYSKWGPKKILGYLKNNYPTGNWPSVTTVENILKKKGLVAQRRYRRRFASSSPLVECNNSNDTWCIDFKGWWTTKDHKKCEPFTLTDAFSRYLICCQQLNLNDTNHVWGVFEKVFREYGLPLRVRSDNGPPFATSGPGRISKLSINLIKAGIMPEWIEPGNPQQNGRHERMHQTLKQEVVDFENDLEMQLKRLEEFKHYYNFIRPHEALDQRCPGQLYQPSERCWDGKLKTMEYPTGYQTIRVSCCGNAKIRRRKIYIGRAFENEVIGLKREEEKLIAYYGPVYLGEVKENNLEYERMKGRLKTK